MKSIKNPIRINRAEQKIEVSKPFLKRANLFGTEESSTLESVRAAYPNYQVVGRSIKKADNEHYRGLTYNYMEEYISKHKDAEKRMAEYNEIRFRAQCHDLRYAHIKKWFLSAYPQIDDFTPEDYKRECEEQNQKQTDYKIIAESTNNEPLAA